MQLLIDKYPLVSYIPSFIHGEICMFIKDKMTIVSITLVVNYYVAIRIYCEFVILCSKCLRDNLLPTGLCLLRNRSMDLISNMSGLIYFRGLAKVSKVQNMHGVLRVIFICFSHGGKFDLNKHVNNKAHKANINKTEATPKLTTCFPPDPTKLPRLKCCSRTSLQNTITRWQWLIISWS